MTNSDIHACAYFPIHKMIGNILPYLENRQEMAKKYLATSKQDEKESLLADIKKTNNAINALIHSQP